MEARKWCGILCVSKKNGRRSLVVRAATQSREVVSSNPTSDMMGIFLRPAPTQGEFNTGSMGRSSH